MNRLLIRFALATGILISTFEHIQDKFTDLFGNSNYGLVATVGMGFLIGLIPLLPLILPPIIVSIQGSYSPVTIGHKESFRNAYKFARNLYPFQRIIISINPGNDKESKPSLNKAKSAPEYMGFAERYACLQTIAKSLMDVLQDPFLEIVVSDIEQKLGQLVPPITSKSICTLLELKKLYGSYAIYYLTFGADNMAQFFDWSHSLAVPGNKFTHPSYPELDTGTYFKTILNGLFRGGIIVLDRDLGGGNLVSNLPVGVLIPGVSKPGVLSTYVTKILGFCYKFPNGSQGPQIVLARTDGWGRTDITNPTNEQVDQSFPFEKYILPAPPGTSSTDARVRIQKMESIEFSRLESDYELRKLIPHEVLKMKIFKNYAGRLRGESISVHEDYNPSKIICESVERERNSYWRYTLAISAILFGLMYMKLC